MNRRELLTLLSGAAWAGPRAAMAQATGKTWRLGMLSPGPARDEKNPDGAILIRALEDRGFVRGKNLAFDARGTGATGKYAAVLDEMKAAGTDVVVTVSYPVAAAAKASGMPVVIAWGGGDPVATKLIDSLARPGGNVTGISDDAAAISTKRLSLLKQLLPNMRRVAMLWNREDLGMTLRYGASARAAQVLGVEVQALGVREPDDFNGVFEVMDRDRPDAILMVTDILTVLNRRRVFDYAAAKRIPAIYEDQQFARDGGLMAYGADPKESFERAADCCARIFQGARPADIPFEQPTRYPFVINLKTAKAIGLEVPATLVALADEVIE
jgi:putative ABC transport system substrate-binding protein